MTLEEARPVRQEDSFDVARTDAWLKQQTDLSGDPDVRQFPGGASNLTYLLRYPGRDLILRRPPRGVKAKSAHDMRREHLIQSRLRSAYGYVPRMVALCTDDSVIGSDFYVMEALDGVILRRDLPAGVTLAPSQARSLCHHVVDRLVELHRVDPVAAGLEEIGRGRGYVGRQVAGWTERYRRARTPNVPSWRKVTAWLADHRPDDVDVCVIHNDYRFDNVVLDPTQLGAAPAAAAPSRDSTAPSGDGADVVVGILDWEMATLGDPLMDLGGALAYWTQADDSHLARFLRRQPTHLPGMLTRREVVDYYCAQTGRSPGNWAFYEVFGLFRLAAIAQQIYYRYYRKETRNPAFRHIWVGVRQLHRRARRLIRASR
ncbi:MAG: phosphotransferase family protein [Micromonosporaceae bacterium]